MKKPASLPRRALAASLLPIALLAGCASAPMQEPEGPARAEKAVAVTQSNKLIKFNAGQPGRILSSRPITGLQPGEQVLGIDYRVAKDALYLLGNSGRLYTLDEDTAQATVVGTPFSVALEGSEFGFDFNPTVDRIRVVSQTGQNLRLHPDTGAVVDSNADMAGMQVDGKLTFAATDANAGKRTLAVRVLGSKTSATKS
ncbi:MAG: DUF4394 domain-containing protein, partial [Haliea sp.]